MVVVVVVFSNNNILSDSLNSNRANVAHYMIRVLPPVFCNGHHPLPSLVALILPLRLQ